MRSISDYTLQNGRIVRFAIGRHPGVLLASKHENSVSYDQSLRAAVAGGRPKTVIIIVDAVSRKYFTSDVSWLWDIDFELLKSENVQRIVLAVFTAMIWRPGLITLKFPRRKSPSSAISERLFPGWLKMPWAKFWLSPAFPIRENSFPMSRRKRRPNHETAPSVL